MYSVRGCRILILFLTLVVLCFILISLRRDSGRAKNLQKYLLYSELPVENIPEIIKLRMKIRHMNANVEVRNSERFGAVAADTTTLLVQAQRDLRRLQLLVVSLAQVRNIASVLLIFSNGYYNERMNQLIGSIDFCKVVQIFYPHSLQLYPKRFPGVDAEDCRAGNASAPCRQRDARLTEHKHHWWWKAHFVFEGLPWSQSHTGSVIFLEENQLVAPDLLYILRYSQRSLFYFPQVQIMSFGRKYANNVARDVHLLTLEYWRPTFDVGMAFNKTTWRNILSLASFYCMYEDYSWSNSLLNLFRNFPNGNVNMVASLAPRVVSTRQFDTMEQALAEVSRAFRASLVYPEKVQVVTVYGPEGRVPLSAPPAPRGRGGWRDLRDQLLCLDPIATTTDEYY